MGLSSSSSKTKTTPVYAPQVTGAASTISSTDAAQQPKITNITDQLGGLVPTLVSTMQTGDPNVNAAKAYNSDVLSGKYLTGNPYLQSVIDASNADVRNGAEASLGTRGLVGGSAMADIVSRNLANNEDQLRYTDYNNQMGRMDTAAGQAAGLSAAGYLPISAIESIAQDQQLPVQTATGAGAGIGGLLGQYTNTTSKSSAPLGGLLASILGSAASGWASSGFKGI